MNFSLIISRDIYPVLTDGWIRTGDELIEMDAPLKNDWKPHWGNPLETDQSDFPTEISVKFQALSQDCHLFNYNLQTLHPTIKELIKHSDSTVSMTLAISPYGHVCLWLSTPEKAILIKSGVCEQLPQDKIDEDWQFKASILEYINKGWENNQPSTETSTRFQDFDRYTKRYSYKYHILLKENEMNIKKDSEIMYNLSDSLIDGSYDKLNTDTLFQHHMGAVPEKIAITLCKGKKDYKIFFLTDAELMMEIFERFYGAHPETKADFIIGIDAEKKEYSLALFRQGLKEPVVIPKEAYQLIVFKNRFEDYRSENYDQPSGAWIW